MQLSCTVTQLADGQWLVRHSSPSVGTVEQYDASREAALAKMQDELQYRIEWCPCSGASQDTVELLVVE